MALYKWCESLWENIQNGGHEKQKERRINVWLAQVSNKMMLCYFAEMKRFLHPSVIMSLMYTAVIVLSSMTCKAYDYLLI